MPVRGGGEDRSYDVRVNAREPPSYRGPKESNPQSFHQGYPDETRGYPRASEPYTAYKVS